MEEAVKIDPHEKAVPAPSQTEHEWRLAVLAELQGIRGCLTQLVVLVAQPMRVVERPEPPLEKEPAAGIGDPHADEEPLGTWILTDERVSAIEDAIEQEQRIRGRAYGG